MAPPHHLRVFIGSPGDVPLERRHAIEVLAGLPSRPLLLGRITVEIRAWRAQDAPLEANDDAQESVIKYVGKPGDCDLTVIVVWSRLGTPLSPDRQGPDGQAFPSGTAWEFENARRAGKPILFYGCQAPLPEPRTPEQEAQYQALQGWLAKLQSRRKGTRVPINRYGTPAEFKAVFQNHMEAFVARRLSRPRRLAWAAVAAAGLLAGATAMGLVGAFGEGTVDLQPIKVGALNSEDGQAYFSISYEAVPRSAEDTFIIQAADRADGFDDRPWEGRGVAAGAQQGIPIMPKRESMRNAVRWTGFVRFVIKRKGRVIRRFPPQQVTALAPTRP
jgi:hypothetical protein